jgi:hypothetical protein
VQYLLNAEDLVAAVATYSMSEHRTATNFLFTVPIGPDGAPAPPPPRPYRAKTCRNSKIRCDFIDILRNLNVIVMTF